MVMGGWWDKNEPTHRPNNIKGDKNMTKVSKAITFIPASYKSVRLEVSEANNFTEANRVLSEEINKYRELIPKEDLIWIRKILGEKK
jgi:hypothetical protein